MRRADWRTAGCRAAQRRAGALAGAWQLFTGWVLRGRRRASAKPTKITQIIEVSDNSICNTDANGIFQYMYIRICKPCANPYVYPFIGIGLCMYCISI